MADKDNNMAYGDYPGQPSERGSGTRGLLGDTFNKFRDKYNAHTQGQSQQGLQGQQQQSHYNAPAGYPVCSLSKFFALCSSLSSAYAREQRTD